MAGIQYRRLECGKLLFFITNENKIYFQNNLQTIHVQHRNSGIRNPRLIQYVIKEIERGRVRDINSLASLCTSDIEWINTSRRFE